MSLVRRVLSRVTSQFPERLVKRVLRESTVLGGLAGQIPQGFENGIHLDFANSFHYIKTPGNDPTIAPFTTLFTFTGGNQSMYRGANGLLVASATNTPRIEYDASGKCLGLLIEGARTNSLIRSTLAGGGPAPTGWTQPTGDGTSDPATSTLGADQVAYLQTGSANRPYLSSTAITFSTSTTYCLSVFIESLSGTLTPPNVIHYSTLLAGASVSYPVCEANPSGGSGGTLTTGRLHMLYTVAGTGGNVALRVGLGASGAATGSVQFSRPQVEAGSFPSSYIPTTTGSVARTADVPVRTISTEYSGTVGTVFVEAINAPGQSGNQSILSIDDNASGNDRIRVQRITATPSLTVESGGGFSVNALDAPGGATSDATAYKYGIAWAVNDFVITRSGATPATDTLGAVPVAANLVRFRLGQLSGAQHLFGHIRRLDYWPERKPNSELQRLTT